MDDVIYSVRPFWNDQIVENLVTNIKNVLTDYVLPRKRERPSSPHYFRFVPLVEKEKKGNLNANRAEEGIP